MKTACFNLLVCLLALTVQQGLARYEPNWKSLDSRPLPTWYDEGKIGIFIHWGVFSVPNCGSEWFWWSWQGNKPSPPIVKYMKDNFRPDFTYPDFGPMFRAEFYDPNRWAKLFKKAGAKYIVLIAKHHEGYTNWPSNYSWNWNAMDVGPNRDLVGELAQAIRSKTDIKFGLYHSMFEWFHPLFQKDQANGYRTQEFVKAKTMPELYEMVNRYKPEVVWSDGEWMAPSTYWNSSEFVAWLYNDSPVKDTVVVNDRWGNDTRCKHGGFWDCSDRTLPGTLMPHKWENCMTIDRGSWGYRANAPLASYMSIEHLLQELIQTVSLGGNLLLNVGPTSYGDISPIFEERLTQMGDWLEVNGEAIYKTHIWTHQNDSHTKGVWMYDNSDKKYGKWTSPEMKNAISSVKTHKLSVRTAAQRSKGISMEATNMRRTRIYILGVAQYTAKKNASGQTTVYALLFHWWETATLTLGDPISSPSTKVTLLGHPEPLSWKSEGKGIQIARPALSINEMPCKWAWALKLEGLKNQEPRVDPSKFSVHYNSISMRKERDF